MMDTKKLYELWMENAKDDADLKKELAEIAGNDEEIYERFYTELKFGTAGLRGIIGAGINRMNVYTVRRATQGLANFLNKTCENPSVAISHDSRIKADVFAREAARVQGFPDDYLFLGSPNEWYRQIGNAVSPLMARVLASGLKQVLERIYRA